MCQFDFNSQNMLNTDTKKPQQNTTKRFETTKNRRKKTCSLNMFCSCASVLLQLVLQIIK